MRKQGFFGAEKQCFQNAARGFSFLLMHPTSIWRQDRTGEPSCGHRLDSEAECDLLFRASVMRWAQIECDCQKLAGQDVSAESL